jgi:hypothetical protein
MKRLVPIPSESVDQLRREKETGIGYQVVSVSLKDGRYFDQVVTSEGCVIQVRGHEGVPFAPDEVASVSVNHKRWNFRDASHARNKSKAASAWTLPSNQAPCRPGDRTERYRHIPRIEQTIQLWSARVKLLRHCLFGLLLFLHDLFKLPRQHPFDGNRFDVFPDSFPFEKTVERRTTVVRSFAIFPYVRDFSADG